MATTPGYSGRPLWAKLGIKEGMKVAVWGAPDELEEWLRGRPAGSCLVADWEAGEAMGIVFVIGADDLEAVVRERVPLLGREGMLWVCWRKRAGAAAPELDFGKVQGRLLETGLVDTKICAVSDDWSGLKFVVRKERRAAWPGPSP